MLAVPRAVLTMPADSAHTAVDQPNNATLHKAVAATEFNLTFIKCSLKRLPTPTNCYTFLQLCKMRQMKPCAGIQRINFPAVIGAPRY
jgi:hypothetical protein